MTRAALTVLLFLLLAACSDDGSEDFTKREITIELDMDLPRAAKLRQERAVIVQRADALRAAELARLRAELAMREARVQELAAALEITSDPEAREVLMFQLLGLHVEVAEARAELVRASAPADATP